LNGGGTIGAHRRAHSIEARGQLDKLTVELDGAGNVDYSKVTTQDAKVTVNGAGHVVVKRRSRYPRPSTVSVRFTM